MTYRDRELVHRRPATLDKMPRGARSSGLGAPRQRPGEPRSARAEAASAPPGGGETRGAASYWLETLGCPKNQVDSDKLGGRLEAGGYQRRRRPEEADLLVVNTCAFIEAAREESIGVVLELAGAKKAGAKLAVTGCLAERYGQELAEAMPEVDRVAGFGVPVEVEAPVRADGPVQADGPVRAEAPVQVGVPVRLAATRRGRLGQPPRTTPDSGRSGAETSLPSFDLLNLPRPASRAPWAYVKVAEGCDRRCGFCAIPSFRGPQRSRRAPDILAEVADLGVQEVVLVAQDLVSWNRDLTRPGRATPRPAKRGDWGRRKLPVR